MPKKGHEITASVRSAITKELSTPELQALDDNYFEKTLYDLGALEGKVPLYDSLRDHVQKQLLLLFAIRFNKVIRGAPLVDATRSEQKVYLKYREFTETFRSFIGFLHDPASLERTKRALVVFHSPITSFVDSAMKQIGPFETGDMAYIPEEDALLLSRFGLIETVWRNES
jgi:hypothetical protein